MVYCSCLNQECCCEVYFVQMLPNYSLNTADSLYITIYVLSF